MANSCPVLVIRRASVKSEARPFAEGEGKVKGSEIEMGQVLKSLVYK